MDRDRFKQQPNAVRPVRPQSRPVQPARPISVQVRAPQSQPQSLAPPQSVPQPLPVAVAVRPRAPQAQVDAFTTPKVTPPVVVEPLVAPAVPTDLSIEPITEPSKGPTALQTTLMATRDGVSRLQAVRRPVLAAGVLGGVGIITLSIFAASLIHPSFGKPVSAAANASDSLHVLAPGDMPFTPLAPQSRPALAKVGAGGGAYDKQRGTYGYIDTLEGRTITVSQQLLPNDAGLAKQAVAAITKDITGVKIPLTTTSGSAYEIASPSATSQSVLYLSGQILIYIQSATAHTPAMWSAYINALK